MTSLRDVVNDVPISDKRSRAECMNNLMVQKGYTDLNDKNNVDNLYDTSSIKIEDNDTCMDAPIMMDDGCELEISQSIEPDDPTNNEMTSKQIDNTSLHRML